MLAEPVATRWAQVPLPAPATGSDEARRLAADILAGSSFRNDRSLLERAQDWLGERLASLFGAFGGGGAPAVIAWLVLAVAAGVVVYLLARGVSPLRSPRRSPRRARVTAVDTAAAPGDSARDWRAESERLEAAGLLDEAMRARFRALVADLVAAGALSDIAGRTTGEHCDELCARAPQVSGDFTTLTRRFEQVWYGRATAGHSDLAAFRDVDPGIVAGARAAMGAADRWSVEVTT